MLQSRERSDVPQADMASFRFLILERKKKDHLAAVSPKSD
jgi:hypothetical protein